MSDLSDFDISELRAKNYLEDDGHPSTEAYRQVFSTSLEKDLLASRIEEHGRDCPICGKRYKEASIELVELRKKKA